MNLDFLAHRIEISNSEGGGESTGQWAVRKVGKEGQLRKKEKKRKEKKKGSPLWEKRKKSIERSLHSEEKNYLRSKNEI